jgi:PAS domain S-box-containing protein
VARRLDPDADVRRAAETGPQGPTGDERLAGLTAVDALPILLVDDRAENLRTLEAVLEPLGYPLHTASSGREALRLLLAGDYALILLDVRMPGLDGLQTAELIKGRARSRDVPIVFLTAARDEVGDIIRGYGLGAVDYVLKPFDAELLRSKVAVFAELESSRRALKRSESFLRGAFEAAPIGKTVLDGARRIVRSNPAFARLIGRDPGVLTGISVEELCHSEDRAALSATLDRVAQQDEQDRAPESAGVDLRLLRGPGSEAWVGLVASSIEPTDFGEPLLLAQWVDLSARRRAERARAELLVEQAARGQAEALAERLRKLQELTSGIEPLGLDELLAALANRLVVLFDAALAELQVRSELDEPVRVRAAGGHTERPAADEPPGAGGRSLEQPLMIEDFELGVVRLEFSSERPLSPAERSLLQDAAERVALAIRRAQLHEEEHRIAVVLQRGLLPRTLPEVAGVEVAPHYEAAGVGAEVGGDWYDAFALPGGRLGIVVGDVAGRSIPAASAMGQLRTVTRTVALGDEGQRDPGEALTRLNRYQLSTGADELFTVVYAILDPAERTIAWAAAGHPPPLIRTRAGQIRYLEAGGGLTGISDTEYGTFRDRIDPGDVLVLYTDGLVERRGESLDAGLARLASVVAAGPPDPEALARHVLAQLRPDDEPLHDDITALVARIS